MNHRDYKHLLSEQTALRRLLEALDPANVLERSGLEARLDEVSEALESAQPLPREPASARLLFRGRPVVGSRGIFAEFGARATAAFADAVAKLIAAQSGPLAATGPVPSRSDSELLITDTIPGSFGFELQEHRPPELDYGLETPAQLALETAQRLLEGTMGSDDDLAAAAGGTERRAVEAVRGFLDILATNQAVCSLEFKDRVVSFADVVEVRRAVERLSVDNLREESVTLFGEFQGVLPQGRTFEFRVAASGEVIRGKIGVGIADPDEINRHLHVPLSVTFVATRAGESNPRFALHAMPSWSVR